MASAVLKRLTSGWLPVVLLVALLLVSLLLMGDATENSARFGRMFSILLVVNVLGILALLALIGIHLFRLLRQYQRGVAGSRMTVRMVAIFAVLSVAPVLVVYYFSMQFLHRGIDSWFDVRVEKALEDALDLGRLSLDLRMREVLRQSEQLAVEMRDVSEALTALTLDELRGRSGATELVLWASSGRVMASSSADETTLVPSRPSEGILLQVRQSGSYVGLDPIQDLGLHVRVVVAVAPGEAAAEGRILQALFRIPARADTLATSVERAYSEYKELAFLRVPLKYSFTLTLSLVLLLSLLTAVLAAFYSARRLAAPIRDLAEGTRAVAAGDYSKEVPATAHDELGFLVQSFNSMTRGIARASAEALHSQHLLEEHNAYLEAVLGDLSSGVITLDEELRVQRANSAAANILGADPATWIGQRLLSLAPEGPVMRQVLAALRRRLEAGAEEWSEELELSAEGSRRVLVCSGTRLSDATSARGYVIVIDDVTALVQAQRDAAWGEVARRLAHEIKNPLTPIQLSAERLRQKYLGRLDAQEARSLDRYTHTIIQQVKTMQEMVNAFSDYARPPPLSLAPLDLNRLIGEVLELYRHSTPGARFQVELAEALPPLLADSGRLRQLLHNLLKNAIEAVADAQAGRIRVSTCSVAGDARPMLELRVCDNGSGIPGSIADRLFEPYVTSKPKGTGLGLAIVKKIVEEHGGTIWPEAQPEGGTCLVVRLRGEQRDADGDAAPTRALPGAVGAGR